VGHFEKENNFKGNILKSNYWFDKRFAAAVKFLGCWASFLIGFLVGLEFWFWSHLLLHSDGEA
jgi:uncharacterized membrane protein (Fun14 family)